MCFINYNLVSSLVSNSLKPLTKVSDTETKASSGQGKNQSIVHSLNKAGNFLALSLNLTPTGEKAKTICKLSLTLSIKKFHKSVAEGS